MGKEGLAISSMHTKKKRDLGNRNPAVAMTRKNAAETLLTGSCKTVESDSGRLKNNTASKGLSTHASKDLSWAISPAGSVVDEKEIRVGFELRPVVLGGENGRQGAMSGKGGANQV